MLPTSRRTRSSSAPASMVSMRPRCSLFGHTGSVDAVKLAIGISEALINTAGGLFVAIFAIVLYNVFVTTEKKLKEDPAAITAFIRAVIKANRFMYQNKDKTLDAAAEITGYTREELDPAYDQLIKGRVFSVNDGLAVRMVQFNIENQVRVGNIPADKKPKVEDIVDLGPATEAVKSLGKWSDDPNYL